MTIDIALPARDITGCIGARIMHAMQEILAKWYALNPAVRRLWAYETELDVNVVLALAPAYDSDEINPAWLANSIGWQRQLQSLIGRTVKLDCLDGDTEAEPYARDPLASIFWRAL